MFQGYSDVQEETTFEHYFDGYNIDTMLRHDDNISIFNPKYITGYGPPRCTEGEEINRWINAHNDSVDNGVHYHNFLISKLPNSSTNDTVKIRLFYIDLYYHTIEYKVQSEYCLDTAFRISNTTGKLLNDVIELNLFYTNILYIRVYVILVAF